MGREQQYTNWVGRGKEGGCQASKGEMAAADMCEPWRPQGQTTLIQDLIMGGEMDPACISKTWGTGEDAAVWLLSAPQHQP